MRFELNEQTWNRGFSDGETGAPLVSCACAVGTAEGWSSSSGYIEAKAFRNGFNATRPYAVRETHMTTTSTITPELRDQLLANYKSEDLTGEDSLFKQLKKALIERKRPCYRVFLRKAAMSPA